jgi:16S rRNA (cytosine967-C5)-methyltransferase
MPVDLVRDSAIDVLMRTLDRDMHLDRALDKSLRRKKFAERGRRFLTQLVYGTVRHKVLCDYVLQPICDQPLDKLPQEIWHILRMAVFQALFCDQVTRPAMVHTSVDLAKRRGHAGLGRMTNAVLRRVPDHLDQVKWPDKEQDLNGFLRIRYSMPKWLVARFIDQFGPEDAEAICRLAERQAPTMARANTLKMGRDDLVADLNRLGIPAQAYEPIPEALSVAQAGPLLRSKRFQEGYLIIQDGASMLPAHLMEPKPGERVLDLCAAPGGKTTHLAQLAGDEAWILGTDIRPFKIDRVLENAERLGLNSVHGCCQDGARPAVREGFDRVLVDAPCSGLGTLRRHPDLKWHLKADDISRLADQQRDLLRSGIRLCKNDGVIVYAVCTFSKQETVEVVQAILEDGCVEPEDGPEYLKTWQVAQGQYQTNPTDEALDGFFLMRFRKRSST